MGHYKKNLQILKQVYLSRIFFENIRKFLKILFTLNFVGILQKLPIFLRFLFKIIGPNFYQNQTFVQEYFLHFNLVFLYVSFQKFFQFFMKILIILPKNVSNFLSLILTDNLSTNCEKIGANSRVAYMICFTLNI